MRKKFNDKLYSESQRLYDFRKSNPRIVWSEDLFIDIFLDESIITSGHKIYDVNGELLMEAR